MALSGPLHGRYRRWAAHPYAPWLGARIMMAAVFILGAIVWLNIRG